MRPPVVEKQLTMQKPFNFTTDARSKLTTIVPAEEEV